MPNPLQAIAPKTRLRLNNSVELTKRIHSQRHGASYDVHTKTFATQRKRQHLMPSVVSIGVTSVKRLTQGNTYAETL